MRVGYSKIGRVQKYDPSTWGPLGADNEAPMLLQRLASRNPDVTFVLLGRNDGVVPREVGLPSNVENPFASEDVQAAVKQATKQIRGSYTTDGLRRYTEGMRAIFGQWWDGLDEMVLWLGQNDQSQTWNVPAVRTGGEYKTQEMYRLHVSYYIDGINRFRDPDPLGREPVWLCSDGWNKLKARDLRWPHLRPVLSQYDWSHNIRHYRYGDTRDPSELGFGEVAGWSTVNGCWDSKVHYEYAQLELGCSVPASTPFNDRWEGRGRFGVLINQSRAKSGRDEVARNWIRPMFPDWVHGSWDRARLDAIGMEIEPLPWLSVAGTMQTVRSTMAVPIRLSGESWATPKAWEMFASGTACFFHPKYDDQGHILPTKEQCRNLAEDNILRQLSEWLRVDTPEELRLRIDTLNNDRDTWEWLITRQRAYFELSKTQDQTVQMIESRLGISREQEKVA